MQIANPIIHKLPSKKITIVPIFDVHIGAEEFCEKEFVDFINHYRDMEDVYFVLGGDIINNGIKSSVSNSYEERYRPSAQKRYACTLLEPIKDRILCAVSGNHEQRSRKETDTDIVYDICEILGIADIYRENIAFLNIKIPSSVKQNTYLNYNLAVTHGKLSLNKVNQFASAISCLDVLIVGHTHKPSDSPQSRFRMDEKTGKIIKENFSVVVASSWLEWGSYASRAMLLPTARVEQKIILSNEKENILISQSWNK